MKKQSYILHVLVAVMATLLLSSCREFFYSEIKYTGSEEDCYLIVNSVLMHNTVPKVYVNHSFFILDDNQYTQSVRSTGALDDADVYIQVGSNNPVSLHLTSSNTGVYTDNKLFVAKTGDSVRLHVSHPVYGEAFGMQSVPATERIIVNNVNVNEYYQLMFDVVYEQYAGAEDEVIALRLDTCAIFGHKKHGYKSDTLPVESYSQTLYSLDPVFGVLDNRQSPAGYYGGNTLYIQGKDLKQEKSISCLLEPHLYKNTSSLIQIDSMHVSVSVQTMSLDTYRYIKSLNALSGRKTSLSDPLSVTTSPENIDIYGLIEDLFNELGSLEGTLLFGNLYPTDQYKYSSNASRRPLGLFGIVSEPQQTEIIYKH